MDLDSSHNTNTCMDMAYGGGGDHIHSNSHSNNSNNSNNNVVNGNNGVMYPVMMMMPVVSSTTSHHQPPNNTLVSSLIPAPPCYFMDSNDKNNPNSNSPSSSSSSSSSLRAKIMSHPHYHRLLTAYVNCQKVGAPSEVVAKLEEAHRASTSAAAGAAMGGRVGEDPGLDQFMEAYCEMLIKYEQELSKPFNEAMLFLRRVESQFKALSLSSASSSASAACVQAVDRNGSSDEDNDVNKFIDPSAEDRELKGQLLRKYSGYLGSLKQEFMKKRKKGKLPKEARQQLLDWWSKHYKWPYPSESQKLVLAESTGLDQKQINNWFINQRKRHWKPSEDMQFVVMDATHPHYYMENVMANPFPMDISPSLL